MVERSSEGVSVTMRGAPSLGRPGEPLLPKAPLRLLLPPGERVTAVDVRALSSVLLGDGLRPEVAQPPHPTSLTGPFERTPGSPEIYGGVRAWPESALLSWREDVFRGHRIVTIVLSPISYQGDRERLRFRGEFEVRVSTEADADLMAASSRMLRRDPATLDRLASLVENPGMLQAYTGLERPRDGDGEFSGLDYLIVGTERWAPQLAEYVEFLDSRGLRAGLFTREWIDSEYEGRDEPEVIQNFIRQAYEESDAEYLLLVGDARDEDGIPHRGLFCQSYTTTDFDIPADLYYGALDGDWNSDGDGRWGEPSEADLFPELDVGRACVSDEEGLANFIRKQKLYQEAPVLDEISRVLMVGEQLWSNPLTWGATYKDEIWFGSDSNGIVTAGVPPTLAVGGLYERDWAWQKEHLMVIINDGVGIVNHQGHAYYNLAAKLHVNDLPQLRNDGVEDAIGFFYSQGCYCGSFDNKASYGGYHSDCFGEQVTTGFGGFAAGLMNSRYGWGDAGGTAGPSQFFDREFFDALFGEQICEAGPANDDAKMDLAWMVDYPGMRWCYYDLNLFGDPAMDIWTARPRALMVRELSGLTENSIHVSLRVDTGAAPLAGALVTLRCGETGFLETAQTDATGLAEFDTDPLEKGLYTLTARRHNYLPHRSQHNVGKSLDPSDEPNDHEDDGSQDAAAAAKAPAELALRGNVPNPFNPRTTIRFEIAAGAPVTLDLFDVKGCRVRRLLDGLWLPMGEHSIEWDGRDHEGRPMSSGVYFTVLISGEASDTGKLLLLK